MSNKKEDYITFNEWLDNYGFDLNDCENGDVKVYSEEWVRLNPKWDDVEDCEVVDSYTEDGIWIVVVDF